MAPLFVESQPEGGERRRGKEEGEEGRGREGREGKEEKEEAGREGRKIKEEKESREEGRKRGLVHVCCTQNSHKHQLTCH